MNKINITYYKTIFGELILGDFNDQLCLCDWRYRKKRQNIDQKIKSSLNSDFVENKTEIIEKTIFQLDEYFKKDRKIFDLPILPIGTEFQKKVWKELIDINYGKTCSYLDLAIKMNQRKAIRAIANANGANHLALIIPCHRVIGSKGELVGYAGGVNTKQKLLYLENESQLMLDF